MAEPQTGLRGTKFSAGTETSLVRDVASRIAVLQPDSAPLIALLNGMRMKKVATNPKFEWFEDELRQNTVTVEGTPGTGTSITVESGQGPRVRVGDILIPDSGEAILVTAVTNDTYTVERSKGSVAADSLADADELIIAGNAIEEGASAVTAKFTQKTAVENYIQIFRDTVQLTDTQAASSSYGGDDRVHQRKLRAIEHKRGIEQAMLFSDGFEDTSGTQTRRGTKGLINFISTNVTDASGTLTQNEFETLIRDGFRYTPTTSAGVKWFLASPIIISAVNFWAREALQTTVGASTFGVRIAKYMSGHGDLNIVRHWLLRDFTEFQKYAFLLDPSNIKYRFLNGLDTKLHVDIQEKKDEQKLDEYRTHAGLELNLEKTHSILNGVTGFAA